ncbi:MAG: tetratricopeptide repeat protein [Kiritimatiellae bacterium]|nr:tetratricopeptide repeat protein [Kiritimatiellia bacterium]MDW8458585.1 tetratricopeptide repeat protein [Verrucomicrobiota bacterium]
MEKAFTTLNRSAICIGLALAAGAFLLYSATLSEGFYPGPLTELIAGRLGVSPFRSTMHSLWGFLIEGLARLPIGPLAVRIHLVGALFAAVSIGLLFSIMYRLRRKALFEQGIPPEIAARVRVFTAVTAALVLMVSIPFWFAATTSHPLMLSLMLMLLSFDLLMRYFEGGRRLLLYLAVLFYALGMGNFASLVLYLPIFGLFLLLALYQHGELTWKRTVQLIVVGLLGAVPLLVDAAIYRETPAYEWREFKGYWQVLHFMLLDQYLSILKAVPRVGWLTVFVAAILPWVGVFLFGVGRKSASAGRGFGDFLLALLLTVLSVVLLLDFKISPWALTGAQPLLVVPYVFIAMWAATLAGYWLALLQRHKGLGQAAGWAWAGIVFAFIGFVGVRNHAYAAGSGGQVFANYARAVADRLDDRPMIVSASSFDTLVQLELFSRGESRTFISLQGTGSLAYRRYVASLFDDPRLKSLATISFQPFLVEWFLSDTNLLDRLAIIDHADLWMAAGCVGVPHGPVYLPLRPDETPNVDDLLSDNRKFWAEFARPAAEKSWSDRHPASAAVRAMLAQTAKAANNLGVLLEDLGRATDAEEAYRAASNFNTNNVSAMVNLHALLQRQGREEAAELEKRLESVISRAAVRQQLWALSYHQGIIRSPQIYAGRGWAWALSGKPALAAADLRKAIELGGDNAGLKMAISALESDEDLGEVSEELLKLELDRDPTNVRAALGLYRLSVRSGRFEEARGRLEALRSLSIPEDFLRTEEALLEAALGNVDRALATLADVVRRNPENLRAWASLAILAGERSDSKMVREALERIQQASAASPLIRYLAARAALREGDREGARRLLELALRTDPNYVPALEWMVRILMSEGDRQGAEAMVDRLITVSPRNAFGNYMLGVFQALRGQYQLAESSYRVSLEVVRLPEALNDLAYVLARQNRIEEALPLIEECLKMSDLQGAAWSTYGYALLSAGRLEEAEDALMKAAAYNEGHPELQFQIARLYEKTGRKEEARKIAEDLTSRSAELLKEDQEELREMLRRLRDQS